MYFEIVKKVTLNFDLQNFVQQESCFPLKIAPDKVYFVSVASFLQKLSAIFDFFGIKKKIRNTPFLI